MKKMNEQISLFDSDNDKRYQFYGHYCSDDWSTKTAMVNGVSDIVMSFSIELSKDELKKICRDAIKIVRFKYGYSIKFFKNNVKKELFIRFDNYTTSKKRDVFEHINLYF
ncbi:PcfU [Enterococcus faecalis]|nr:PcfU [Campylobacter jejuni]EGO8928656.1 PcfU [Enterococcus faecalis]MVH72813.1 PcfU [Staphylococcus aureus]MBO6374045.1 PcfU [Enterococcus faecalis]MUO12579.1 PcfU [Enterococcus faecalis]